MVDLLCVGDLNADLTISLADNLVIGSDTDGTIGMHGGGSAANVAVWAARAGSTVAFVGVVGDDDLGTFLVDGMVQAGVEAHVIRRGGSSTRSVAAIVGPDGNRSLVSDLSGQTALVDGDVDTNQLAAASWLHLTGYTFLTEQSRSLFVQLTKQASELGIPWSVDPSAAQLIRARSDVA
jgi:ribokinase